MYSASSMLRSWLKRNTIDRSTNFSNTRGILAKYTREYKEYILFVYVGMFLCINYGNIYSLIKKSVLMNKIAIKYTPVFTLFLVMRNIFQYYNILHRRWKRKPHVHVFDSSRSAPPSSVSHHLILSTNQKAYFAGRTPYIH